MKPHKNYCAVWLPLVAGVVVVVVVEVEPAGAGVCCPLIAGGVVVVVVVVVSSANTAVAIAAVNKPIAKNFVFIDTFPL
jgi:hypothetical protein